ncbi:MAG TPA: DUF1992 domain-containing protein [Tepidisphaeraceae bacterium]|nr:DUF1992 domain-containing protein [Tepidisphaeraceae bacterium]
MSLKNVDIEAGLRRLADRRIEDAMKEGKFDNLAGAGQPLELEPMPAEENARMLWWALKIMRQNDVVLDEIRYRKSIELLKKRMSLSRDEEQVKTLVGQINELVRKLNTMGTNIIQSTVAGVDLEVELARVRA